MYVSTEKEFVAGVKEEELHNPGEERRNHVKKKGGVPVVPYRD